MKPYFSKIFICQVVLFDIKCRMRNNDAMLSNRKGFIQSFSAEKYIILGGKDGEKACMHR